MDGWLLWLVGAGPIAVVAGWLAFRRWRQRRARPAARRPALTGPQAGEIWWADIRYDDGIGSKVRPCLVLRAGRRHIEVLKITSQDKRHRRDHVRLPTRQWDPRAARDSSLDVTNPVRVPVAAFVRRAGDCDAKVWRGVRRLHGIGVRR
jgi:hypothetical protein